MLGSKRIGTNVLAAVTTIGLVSSSLWAATNAGDNERTGWYPNQPSLTPSLVSGGTFGQLFSTAIVGQVYAQPLVANGYLLVATEANWIYGIDPETGAMRWARNLGTPWNASDIGCADLAPTIGVTGTPVIDETTGTAYLLNKTYANGTSGAAAWYMHGFDVTNGVERSGFPVLIQGNAQNLPGQAFGATKHHQRPGLLLMDGVVYAAFGAHCDTGPYQGWVIGVSTAGQIKALWVDQGGANQSGGGIWQSGGGLVSPASGQIFFASGNGHPPSTPRAGNNPPGDLGQAVVKLQVQADGTLRAVDFFAPYDAASLDGWDADFGSSGPLSLPSAYFGTPAYPRLLVQVGKQGYVDILNRDALGGFQQGTGGGDAILGRIGPYGGAWSRPTAWPGDGGYVYIPTASGGNSASGSSGYLQVFKYGLDVNSKPTLALVGSSSDAFGFSSSSAVVTSDGTISGSALVWIVWAPSGSGAGASLRCYDAVPVNGVPNLRWSAPVGTSAKFTPPGVGPNGRIYVGTRDGHVYGFGSPITTALTGSTLNFPTTIITQNRTLNDVLTATRSVTVTALATSDPHFSVINTTPPLPAALTTGQTLTVPIRFAPTNVGLVAGSLNVTHSLGAQQFGLQGVGQAGVALLTASPVAVSFGGTTTGGHLASVVIFSNQGSLPLTVNSVSLPQTPFSVSGMPPVGYVLNSGQSVSVNVYYDPTAPGYLTDNITINSTGGVKSVPLSGTAQAPGVLSVTPLSLTYGNVAVGSSASMSFVVKNIGNSTVTITKSKPPIQGQYTNLTDLFEGSTLVPGQAATETVQYTPTKLGFQSDVWIINSDSSAGLQHVVFNGSGFVAAPTAGGWTMNGNALLDGTTPDSLLILTPNDANQAGSAFCPASFDPSNLVVEFDATIDQGTGADGMTLALADPAGGATPTSLGSNGGSLGFSGIPGIAVALDTFQNDFDPSSNFVGVTNGPISPTNPDAFNWVATSTSVLPLRSTPRHVSALVDQGVLSVSVDGTPAVSSPVVLGSSALIGFTGGTGTFTDRHAVSNVSVTGHAVVPVLSMAADAVAGVIHLSWSGGSAPYTLQRSPDPLFGFGAVTLTSGTATTFDDNTLNSPAAYFYRLQ